MRNVERGHFNDITLEVATISESSALLLTVKPLGQQSLVLEICVSYFLVRLVPLK